MYERDKLISDLKQAVVEVTFTKVNGERRIMRCTLDPKHLPPMTIQQIGHIDEQHKRPENLDIIVVWDVEVCGFRSFRVDSVQYVQEVNSF